MCVKIIFVYVFVYKIGDNLSSPSTWSGTNGIFSRIANLKQKEKHDRKEH